MRFVAVSLAARRGGGLAPAFWDRKVAVASALGAGGSE